jgi:hypothetical protein
MGSTRDFANDPKTEELPKPLVGAGWKMQTVRQVLRQDGAAGRLPIFRRRRQPATLSEYVDGYMKISGMSRERRC